MTTTKPDWDLIICADIQDQADHLWFPARARTCREFTALEGMHPRNIYLTSRAIEQGSYVLFKILYRAAAITGGKVLHTSDYEEQS